MSLITVKWEIDIVARSSIVHRDSYSPIGTSTGSVFRTEQVSTADGEIQPIPIVSGSSFRGVLRRVGEQLTAEVLNYEDVGLPIPAAHLLTNGGRLAKSAAPFTDEHERHLKSLIPQIAVFGGSASGRIMEGLLKVGKVLPVVAELVHILERPPTTALPSYGSLITSEAFSHLPDHRPHGAQPPYPDNDETTSPLGRFTVETLPAGTRLETYARMKNATGYQVAFMRDVLEAFADSGHLGGRSAAGHGAVSAAIKPKATRGQLPTKRVDWRAELARNRDEAIAVLSKIT
ncbi:MAG: RAMP superfamily CRISPR-associated protein [Mycobacterium sp.]